MKLSLSLPALERLLGGDTELEIELRRQIVHEFTKQHLNELTKTDAFKALSKECSKAAEDIGKLANDEIKRHVGHYIGGGWSSTPYQAQLTNQIEELIKTCAAKAVDAALAKAIVSQVEYYERRWAPHIAKKIEEAMNNNINAAVSAEFDRRLNALNQNKS